MDDVTMTTSSSTMIGLLLDVSASMKNNIPGELDITNGWIRVVIDALDSWIIKNVSRDNNKVFAIGFGGQKTKIFDILNTLKDVKDKLVCEKPLEDPRPLRDVISVIVKLLEQNGAPFLSQWVKPSMLELHVSKNDALVISKMLHDNSNNIRKKIVYECLPPQCRSGVQTVGFLFKKSITHNIESGSPMVTCSIKEAVAKIQSHIFKPSNVTPKAIMDYHTASAILRGTLENSSKMTNKRSKEIITSFEPFIFSGSPLNRALHQVKDLFKGSEYKNHRKLLFVLSDGIPTDKSVAEPPIHELKQQDVCVVSCMVTLKHTAQPKRLYAIEQPEWNDEEKYMFRLSSSLKTQSIPRTIFIKRGWTIDIENNQVKLFVQINHPDIITDVVDLSKSIFFCEDALSDLLTSVHLDVYIGHALNQLKAPLQESGTCYANACASVMHLAMHRILGRDGGYPEFNDLRQEIIGSYGMHGGSTEQVLTELCPKYRLHFKIVDVKDAMTAIVEKRPVIATFELKDTEWDAFRMFYIQNPKGILTNEELTKFPKTNSDPTGHAVVLVGYNKNFLRFMNSWGSVWADSGFFRVSLSDGDVLKCTFYDVYWLESDLKPCEISEYKENGREVSRLLINRLQSLQSAKHTCQYCNEESAVLDFKGTMELVKCPKCKETFSIRETGPDVALAVYLTLLQVQ